MLPADTGTAVINPSVMNKSYVNATLKFPNKLATKIKTYYFNNT